MRGIADLILNPFQLDHRLLLGGRRHPGETLNVRAQCRFDGVNHLDSARFAVGRECAVDVGLAEGFSQIVVGGTDASPPAWLLLFGAGQCTREEVEILIDHRFVQVRRDMMNHLPAHVDLPVLERMRGDQFFFGAEKIRRGHNVVVAGWRLHRLQISLPIDGGRELPHLRQRHFIVDVLGIAAFYVIHLRLGHRGFQVNHGAGVGCGLSFRFACQHEHLLNVSSIFRKQLLRLVIVFQVVVAIRKTQPALIDLRDDFGSVVIILLAGETEEGRIRLIVRLRPRAREEMMKAHDLQRDFFLGLQRRDALQFRLHRLQSGGLNAAFVHARRPVIANLLRNGGAARIVFAGGFQSFAQQTFIPQLQPAARAPIDLVGRNRIRSQPFVASIFIKIVAWIQRLVGEVGIEMFEFRCFGRIGAGRACAGGNGVGTGSLGWQARRRNALSKGRGNRQA